MSSSSSLSGSLPLALSDEHAVRTAENVGEEQATPMRPRASNPQRFQGSLPEASSHRPDKNRSHGGTTYSERHASTSSLSSSREGYGTWDKADRRTVANSRAPFLRRPIRHPTTRNTPNGAAGQGPPTVADWLASQGQRPPPLASAACVRIDNISPTSSLQAMVVGMREALDRHGILNLDAPWDPALDALFTGSRTGSGPNGVTGSGSEAAALPTLPVLRLDDDFPDDAWIVQAKVILSPFARPTGWYVQLANRSLAHALLSAARKSPLVCASRNVMVRPATLSELREGNDDVVQELGADYGGGDSSSGIRAGGGASSARHKQQRGPSRDEQDPRRRLRRQLLQVSDSTLRIENCSEKTSLLKLLNLFSRYDLRQIPPWKKAATSNGSQSSGTSIESTCIVPWTGRTSDGKVPPTTWLVHFRNASWARAALRELQGVSLDGRALLLAQYPQQITSDDDHSHDANGGGVLRQRTSNDSATAVH
jgi:hypothetical protein